MSTSTSPRLSFIDWMKCCGILIIVIGHVAARTSDWLVPPIYPKQLGVAFFVFVTGYTLANEKRLPLRVLYNRLFDVYVYGIALALCTSVVTLVTLHDVAESNYLPFLGGINVIFNFLPANPTTWYVGTYIHLLLLWALVLRRRRIGLVLLTGAVVIEICARAFLISRVGGVLPYMVMPNWFSSFLLGLYFGQHPGESHRPRPLLYIIAFALFLGLWGFAVGGLFTRTGYPWMAGSAAVGPLGPWVVSVAITTLYSLTTLLLFEATRGTTVPRAVEFVSRETLFIFLTHMPLYYLLRPVLAASPLDYAARSLVLIVACVLGLSICGMLVKAIFARWLDRDQIWRALFDHDRVSPEPTV